MFALITTLSTNLLRTYIIYRFNEVVHFGQILMEKEKRKSLLCIVFYFDSRSASDILFARYECDNKYSADFFDYSVL